MQYHDIELSYSAFPSDRLLNAKPPITSIAICSWILRIIIVLISTLNATLLTNVINNLWTDFETVTLADTDKEIGDIVIVCAVINFILCIIRYTIHTAENDVHELRLTKTVVITLVDCTFDAVAGLVKQSLYSFFFCFYCLIFVFLCFFFPILRKKKIFLARYFESALFLLSCL